MSERIYDSIGRAGAVLILLTVVDKILALGREVLVASRFGISSQLDVFNLAWAVPSITCLFFSGALTGAFVPLYVQWSHTRRPSDVQNAVMILIWGTIALFAILTIVLIAAAPILFPLLGFSFSDELREFGITISRLLALLVLFDGSGILLGALLQAEKRFFILQAAALSINVVTIMVLLLYEKMGIFALGAGLLAGTACKTACMAMALRRRGIRFFRKLFFDPQPVRTFVLLALPLFGSELVVNLNFLVDQIMAGTLSAGSISTLKYAYRVYDMPIQIIVIALARALFPFASEAALDRSYERMQGMFQNAIIFLGLITAPVICIGSLFSREIMQLLFERGAFDAAATQQTASTFVCYNIGLFFYAYAFINGTFFSALQATTVLFVMGCVSIILNVVLNGLLMNFIGVPGIALSTSITAGIVGAFFITLLVRRCAIRNLRPIVDNLLRIIVAAFCTGVIGKALYSGVALLVAPLFFRLGIAMIASGAVYGVVLWTVRTSEIEGYIGFVKRMFIWQKAT